MKEHISITILAAGASTRLGQPKQLLEFKGKTLIAHAIEQALEAKCGKVSVILGANHEKVQPTIQSYPVEIIQNTNWEEGIGNSIALGISTLEKQDPKTKGALLMLCDQPFVTSDLLKKLLEKFQTSSNLVTACSYDNTIGIPAIFDQQLFEELKKLKGDRGAKKVILKYEKQAEFVSFVEGGVDVDTLEDYEALIRKIG